VTWRLTAMLEDAEGPGTGPTSFSSEVEFYRVEDGVLTVRTVGLETRIVEGRCIGYMAIPLHEGAR